MKRTLTLCAVATMLVGVSVPAAVVAVPEQSSTARVTEAATLQTFAATPSAQISLAARDAFGVELIPPPPPVVIASADSYAAGSSSSSSASYAGQFAGFLATWPASGAVNDGFGYRDGGEFHKGIDIMAGYGAPIVAASPGVVTSVSQDGGWGQYVKIDHGSGIGTLYSHMISGSPTVSAGQTVAAGEVIGAVGDTGYVTVAHLHFEVYVGGSPVDPMGMLP